ncbi:NAD(P)/FAD-dependent oxidoreductase [Mucilaginibacter sp. SMC90]|uniref:NAD(P)/FAD-dependent oxidoreductase n=1 Tax=Mucilaginibacter sp. SMC90 TaxID=2929803 RepID=UPI001FB37027|nr:NAD(P)/FAD-dependent oxidoreductase [Mucilaginibacter sp. SMC90]UOE51368.1 NAD(P)/FAD-dependent oxidoreductase [Mucilaginibacter sp. SMC90]
MDSTMYYDAIIVGGSNAGLSAGLALGRALRKVLIIDSNLPCNRQTPYSHNFLTRDGDTPEKILTVARTQLETYTTVSFITDLVTRATKDGNYFRVDTKSGKSYAAKKIIFATGIKDIMPAIKGFDKCWGISAIHCPYCHGYEFKGEKTGILANGDSGFDTGKLISNWTKDLTLYTNGSSTLTVEQTGALLQHGIKIVEKEVSELIHHHGQVQKVIFKDGSEERLSALYARLGFTQHCTIPEQLGCELTEQGYLRVDIWMKTTTPGIYACGDNTTFMRSIANAAYNGSVAGAALNMELINESFA